MKLSDAILAGLGGIVGAVVVGKATDKFFDNLKDEIHHDVFNDPTYSAKAERKAKKQGWLK